METIDEYHHEKMMMNFSLLSVEKNDYYHQLMTMNGMRDELIKKEKKSVSHHIE
jgi:hypothetical protein